MNAEEKLANLDGAGQNEDMVLKAYYELSCAPLSENEDTVSVQPWYF